MNDSTQNNMKWSDKYNIEQNKQGAQKYIQCDLTYIHPEISRTKL